MNRTTSREGYSDDFRSRHEAEQAQQAAEERQRKADNDEARRRHLATLEAERETKRQAAWAEVEAQLAPARERLKRQWLVDHPDQNAEAFERKAWPQLKKTLLEDGQRDAVEEAKASLRATGGYGRF